MLLLQGTYLVAKSLCSFDRLDGLNVCLDEGGEAGSRGQLRAVFEEEQFLEAWSTGVR